MYRAAERFLLFPWYPILFSAYPVLTLGANNIYQVNSLVLVRPLIVFVLAGTLLFLAIRYFFREWHTPALATGALILVLASYGHVRDYLSTRNVQVRPLGMALVWIMLAVCLIAAAVWAGRRFGLAGAAPSLNLMAVVLILFPVAKMIQFSIVSSLPFELENAPFEQLRAPAGTRPPDIYYIILDSYGRSDVLQRAYGYDNSGFIRDLTRLGFYVPECSASNYWSTELSLTSTLNLDYLPQLSEHFAPDQHEHLYLFRALKDNSVRRILEAAGYRTVAFATGFTWTEWYDADTYLAPPEQFGRPNEFEVILVGTSFGRILDDLGLINLDDISGERYRERTRLILDSFDDLARMAGPKFVFIHVIMPHPPFVFDANGNPIAPDSVTYEQGYVESAEFINREMVRGARELIAGSSTPPVIILQGDHGPWIANWAWRLSNLNAYYLPGHAGSLYPTITPVNTFRLVLNSYLGADYDPLPDESFYSILPDIYRFMPVPNDCAVQ